MADFAFSQEKKGAYSIASNEIPAHVVDEVVVGMIYKWSFLDGVCLRFVLLTYCDLYRYKYWYEDCLSVAASRTCPLAGMSNSTGCDKRIWRSN